MRTRTCPRSAGGVPPSRSARASAEYGRYDGPPSRAEMEKIFFLDNEDLALIKGHRGRHIRCGFALQLVTVRCLGCFLADPLEVPNEIRDVVAAQLGIEDPSCVKRCTERDRTRPEHTWDGAETLMAWEAPTPPPPRSSGRQGRARPTRRRRRHASCARSR
ncbi:DUF4158 domain-containing protein, partial [Nonomuraea sp. NPDC005501]|uniref:DUF4158 domain-containing protein n=1 Tax=Nonomuraea sp. NPDC005501 TaxID=3156884 RepID=UPI0033BCDE88